MDGAKSPPVGLERLSWGTPIQKIKSVQPMGTPHLVSVLIPKGLKTWSRFASIQPGGRLLHQSAQPAPHSSRQDAWADRPHLTWDVFHLSFQGHAQPQVMVQ